jgi:Cys-rich four helix bundle protein (predicted Tat secretion target)
MDRREALKVAGGMAAGAALFATPASAQQHEFHKHVAIANANEDLVAEALACSRTGEACLRVCFEVMAMGDASMAACAKSVRELVIACDALAGMAMHDSRHLQSYAKVTAEICAECREQCLKHKEHSQCLDCANSCEDCIKVCEKYTT